MNPVRRNLVANFVGRGWTALLSLALVPVYVRLLGIEAYGLVGCFVSLNAIIAFLDLGLTTTLNRELARLSVSPGREQDARDLVRTFEVVYWALGFAIGLGLVALAPAIAHHWIHPKSLSPDTVARAFIIMGLVVAFQWPDSLYAGGLLGLQRQVLLNVIRVVIATIQGPGTVLVLLFVSRTIGAYFVWQLVMYAIQTVVLALYLWRSLPTAPHAPRFRQRLWGESWRLTAGITGISVCATILTQSDKIVLSRMLSLRLFGYYALATTIASALTHIVVPIHSAVFPRLAQLVALGREAELAALYHKSCQVLSLLLVPLAVVGSLFALPLLSMYVKDAELARNVAPLFSLLLIGTALNCLMALPFALQLAYGWTSLSLYKNIAAIALFVPGLIWAVDRYGAVGAACLWIAVNAAYVLLEIPIMHRRLLRREMWPWYISDLGAPVAVCILLATVGRAVAPAEGSRSGLAAAVLITCSAALVGSALSMHFPRMTLVRLAARRGAIPGEAVQR